MRNQEAKIVLGVKEGTPKFSLGHVIITTELAHVIPDDKEIQEFLFRHVTGDWGDLEQADKEANDHDLEIGERLVSAYHLKSGEKIYIITEHDRSVTTILLAEQY